MNFDEAEIDALKRKSRRADNIMLNNSNDSDEEDEIRKEKNRSAYKQNDLSGDEHDYSMTNKKLLYRSDFDLKIPT